MTPVLDRRHPDYLADRSLQARVRRGVQHRHNWLQLVRFAGVGASGYVVNLATFWLVVHGASLSYQLGSLLAFLTSVTSNFILNRHWTFDASDGHAGQQAMRFLTLSTAVYVGTFLTLTLLIEVGGLSELPAQAIAVMCATPLNFLGNRLWSFAESQRAG